MTIIRDVVQDRFGARLGSGVHPPNDDLPCANEAASVARGIEWTDNPAAVGLPDMRPINDAPWTSPEGRARGLVPLMEALWEWESWSAERRGAWTQAVAQRTIAEVLPIALRAVGLEAEAARCETEPTGASAKGAARAAWAAATEAAWAARAAWAAATEGAAWAAAAEEVLQLACRIWIEEAESGEAA
ncbi:MAG: hypothetical protein ACREJL_01260 [Candidatus Methylomirabilales bacterium]